MDWPFNLPKKKVVLTSRHVQEGAPILYVSHDDSDGRWEFHPHEKFGTEEADVRLASLKSLYQMDESLGQLADLPGGWHAWREMPGENWQREKMTS